MITNAKLTDRMKNVDDVFTFTKRLWTIAKEDYNAHGMQQGTLIVVGEDGSHSIPTGAMQMNTPDDIAAVTKPWMDKLKIRGVGLVTEGVAVSTASLAGNEEEETHALLVLCQWKDGMCSGLACGLDGAYGAAGKAGALSQEQVLQIAKMPFAPSTVRVGKS